MEPIDALRLSEKYLQLMPWLVPLWIGSGIICWFARRRRWIAPLWFAMVPPVILLYGTLLRLIPTEPGRGPDAMADAGVFLLLMVSLPETLSGLFLLLGFPRGPAWGVHAMIPCLLAGAVSYSLFGYVISHTRSFRERPQTAEVIVPNGFTGMIFITADPVGGVAPQRVEKITRYVVPADGKLLTSDTHPLFAGEVVGHYQGQPALPGSLGRLPRPGLEEQTVRFLSPGTTRQTVMYWVGSDAAYAAFRKHNDPFKMAP